MSRTKELTAALADMEQAKNDMATLAHERFLRIETVEDACRGLIGLCQIVAGRDDVPPEVSVILTTNHRFVDAQDILMQETKAPPSHREALQKLCDHLERIPYRDSARLRVTETPFYEQALAALAQGMEAGTGETRSGSTVSEASGDSPTPQSGNAPSPSVSSRIQLPEGR